MLGQSARKKTGRILIKKSDPLGEIYLEVIAYSATTSNWKSTLRPLPKSS